MKGQKRSRINIYNNSESQDQSNNDLFKQLSSANKRVDIEALNKDLPPFINRNSILFSEKPEEVMQLSFETTKECNHIETAYQIWEKMKESERKEIPLIHSKKIKSTKEFISDITNIKEIPIRESQKPEINTEINNKIKPIPETNIEAWKRRKQAFEIDNRKINNISEVKQFKVLNETSIKEETEQVKEIEDLKKEINNKIEISNNPEKFILNSENIKYKKNKFINLLGNKFLLLIAILIFISVFFFVLFYK